MVERSRSENEKPERSNKAEGKVVVEDYLEQAKKLDDSVRKEAADLALEWSKSLLADNTDPETYKKWTKRASGEFKEMSSRLGLSLEQKAEALGIINKVIDIEVNRQLTEGRVALELLDQHIGARVERDGAEVDTVVTGDFTNGPVNTHIEMDAETRVTKVGLGLWDKNKLSLLLDPEGGTLITQASGQFEWKGSQFSFVKQGDRYALSLQLPAPWQLSAGGKMERGSITLDPTFSLIDGDMKLQALKASVALPGGMLSVSSLDGQGGSFSYVMQGSQTSLELGGLYEGKGKNSEVYTRLEGVF